MRSVVNVEQMSFGVARFAVSAEEPRAPARVLCKRGKREREREKKWLSPPVNRQYFSISAVRLYAKNLIKKKMNKIQKIQKKKKN